LAIRRGGNGALTVGFWPVIHRRRARRTLAPDRRTDRCAWPPRADWSPAGNLVAGTAQAAFELNPGSHRLAW